MNYITLMKLLNERLIIGALIGLQLATVTAEVSPPAAEVVRREPASEAEVQLQNKYLDKVTPQQYADWLTYVNSLSAENQVWARTLEDKLGSFYAPPYMKDIVKGKIDPENDAWGYVKDQAGLPRVLIIGDSISRGYTAPVRRELKGKANVHRAPANCGKTENFFKDGEVWLLQNGSNHWDAITLNFGIHDKDRNPAEYAEYLKRIIARLRQTGAALFWVRTTPFGPIREQGPSADLSVKINETADRVAKEEGLEVIDSHGAVIQDMATLQTKDNIHVNDDGLSRLGRLVATALEPHLKAKP